MPFRKKGNNRTIFRYLLGPMLLLVLLELVLWEGSFVFSDLFQKLDQNARDLINQQVVNRTGYLQNEMLHSWSDLDGLADQINEKAQDLQEQGIIDFETLDKSSENATPLLLDILSSMIHTMRTAHVTGIYVIFNNEDLDEGLEDKPGIYIRDSDPLSKSSSVNGDLFFERAPLQVVEESNISTDSMWRPRFEFKKNQEEYYDFFYMPYQTAYHNTSGYSALEMGYWGKTETLADSSAPSITYSMPLINQAGMVYGVVGVDITLSYLNKLLPLGELSEQNIPSSYLLAVAEGDDLVLTPVHSRGNAYYLEDGQLQLLQEEEDYLIEDGDERYYTVIQYLDLYVSNTPYSQQRWLLSGIVNEKDLYSFSIGMRNIIRSAILILFLLGVCISLWASYMISKPIRALADQVEASVPGRELLLKRTGILEVDKLEQKMEALDRSIRNTALKFTNILKMSSIKMAGFEYNVVTKELFLSDNFFEIFLDPEINSQGMTLETFLEKRKEYEKYLVPGEQRDGERLYEIPDGQENVYVRVRFGVKENVYTGVAENVTGSFVEKRRIEYERDHDALTGLWNRRAFLRKAELLLKQEEEALGIAGLLMVDLDNLKYVNDTYGHENGDRYIRKAAEIFQICPAEHTLISRISGDEFNLLFYGYREETQLRHQLEKLKEAIRGAKIWLPDYKDYPLRASGGFAWFPKDSTSLEELQKYADYAMYQVKRSGKGDMKEFSREEYERDSHREEGKRELDGILRDSAVQFFFQPIVDCRTGEVFAYEALMRSRAMTLKDPEDILEVAKETGRLDMVEALTWFGAMKACDEYRKNGIYPSDCRIFINSISNQMMSDQEIRTLEEKYPRLLQNVVMEITENEPLDERYLEKKKEVLKRWNASVALDDWGSGYNGGKTLLIADPEYIKLDMEIVHDMDTDPDRCRMVESMLDYAHKQDQKIVAEGIETEGELKQALRLGVDYVQGYLLAKPQPVPAKPDSRIVELIRQMSIKK